MWDEMGRRSSIEALPEEVLEHANQMIADGCTIQDILDYLDEAGHERSKSAVGRHKQKVEKVAARLRRSREITKALAQEMGEASLEGKQGRLLVETIRSMVMDLLTKIDEAEDGRLDLDPKEFSFLAKAVKDLGQALRADQDFEDKIRARIEREAAEQAAAAVDRVLGAGVSDETRMAIRRELGMAD